MLYYFAVFTPAAEGGYVVTFPDIPEALTEGETLQDCLVNATDVLGIVTAEYASARRPLPAPSSLDQVKEYAQREASQSGACGEPVVQLIQAPGTDNTPVRINVSLPKSVLDELDMKARAKGMNRSRFIAEATRCCM